jgi:hypothetical protein
VKRGADVRNGMSCLQLEDFNINGTIATVSIGMFVQRNGDMRLLCSGSGRNQKRDNDEDCGDREMHLVKVS